MVQIYITVKSSKSLCRNFIPLLHCSKLNRIYVYNSELKDNSRFS